MSFAAPSSSSLQLPCLRLPWLVPRHHSHSQPLPCKARLLVATGFGAVMLFAGKTKAKSPPAPCCKQLPSLALVPQDFRSATGGSTRRTARASPGHSPQTTSFIAACTLPF